MSLIKEHFFNEINKGQILSVPMYLTVQTAEVIKHQYHTNHVGHVLIILIIK